MSLKQHHIAEHRHHCMLIEYQIMLLLPKFTFLNEHDFQRIYFFHNPYNQLNNRQ